MKLTRGLGTRAQIGTSTLAGHPPSWLMEQLNESVRFHHATSVLFETVHFLALQNEQALRNLRLGMFIPTLLSAIFRLLFRRSSLPPSKGSLALYVVTYLPALFLSRYLERMGTTRRDPTTGALISPGEDLNQPGVTEWCFDILYVTCESASLKEVG
jgi:hypothetical protein